MSNFVAPGQQRYLRACMVCSIVQTYAVRRTLSARPFYKSQDGGEWMDDEWIPF